MYSTGSIWNADVQHIGFFQLFVIMFLGFFLRGEKSIYLLNSVIIIMFSPQGQSNYFPFPIDIQCPPASLYISRHRC